MEVGGYREVAAPNSRNGIIAGMGWRSKPFSRDSEARNVASDIEVANVLSAKGGAMVSAE
jgi:hypothetical protein